MRPTGLALTLVLLAAAIGCCPSRSQQTGTPVIFSGTIGPDAGVVHDFSPPPRTTQSDIDITWSSGNLRFSELMPTCPAGQEEQCVRLTDPIEAPASTPRQLRLIVTNQQLENRNRMKFLIENTSGETATYTFTITPRSAGCT